MRKVTVTVVAILLAVAQLPSGLPLPSTVPAFLWWSHQDGLVNNGMKEAVNYQTLSSKELAKSVLSEGGWSNLLCSAKAAQQPVDLAFLFVGREFQTSDISGDKYAESALLNMLKVSLTRANFSLALPYIAASEEHEAMESLLMSEFAETCGQNFGATKIAFLGSCSLKGGNYEKLVDFQAVHDYLDSRMEERRKGNADLVVICPGNSRSERQIFSELIHSVEQSGDKYTALYVSDSIRSIEYPSYRELGRFLAESTAGNGSFNSTICDGVCQLKTSLLEGAFVAIVLLIILISGLCCMMGIDTPTRFEVPQDS